MMTLIIYDTTGRVLQAITGSYAVPSGVPYLEVNVPEGRYVVSVDVSHTPHTAVLSDPPRDLVAERLAALEQRMNKTEDIAYMGLETAVVVYEQVYPFLP